MVERTTLGVDVASFAQEGSVLVLVLEENAGDVDFLAANNNNTLATQELLGNN